jgi:hypothetical protein
VGDGRPIATVGGILQRADEQGGCCSVSYEYERAEVVVGEGGTVVGADRLGRRADGPRAHLREPDGGRCTVFRPAG